jgi:hypothetical protein
MPLRPFTLAFVIAAMGCGNLAIPNGDDAQDAHQAAIIAHEVLDTEQQKIPLNCKPGAVRHTLKVFSPVNPAQKQKLRERVSNECSHEVRLIIQIYSGNQLQSETSELIKPKGGPR